MYSKDWTIYTAKRVAWWPADALSPCYMRARGLRAERVREAEHFWAGSAGKEIA